MLKYWSIYQKQFFPSCLRHTVWPYDSLTSVDFYRQCPIVITKMEVTAIGPIQTHTTLLTTEAAVVSTSTGGWPNFRPCNIQWGTFESGGLFRAAYWVYQCAVSQRWRRNFQRQLRACTGVFFFEHDFTLIHPFKMPVIRVFWLLRSSFLVFRSSFWVFDSFLALKSSFCLLTGF